MSFDQLLALEAISRAYPDRVVRLVGSVRHDDGHDEALELLIYRGFSSCITHPTVFDPDQSVLPDGATIAHAFLLQGPLNPAAEQLLVGPVPVQQLLDPAAWG
ncbi:MAG: hypothetical protein ACON4T_02885 [Synechococcus sp.]